MYIFLFYILLFLIYMTFVIFKSIKYVKSKKNWREKNWEWKYEHFEKKFKNLFDPAIYTFIYIGSIWVIIEVLNINNLFIEFFLHLSKVIVFFSFFPNLYFRYFNYFPIFKSSHQFNDFRKTVKIFIIAIFIFALAMTMFI